MDEGDGQPSDARTSTAPLLFKKRNRARAGQQQTSGDGQASGSGASTPTGLSGGGRSRISHLDDDEGEDGEHGSALGNVVRRTGNRSARNAVSSRSKGGEDGRKKADTPRLHDLGNGLNDEESFDIRKDVLSNRTTARALDDDAMSLPSYLQQQANVSESTYSPAALEALKASTPSRDTSNGDAVNETLIPSEAVIRQAKERRRRLAQESQAESADNFISLRSDANNGPHPESRLQREEDDVGSGEEDYAKYTGATERVAIDEEGIRRERQSEREKIREAVEMAVDGEADEESDESEREWERAQMSRMNDYLGAGSKSAGEGNSARSGRTKNGQPFKPAPIPGTTPLPSISDITSSVQNRLSSIKDATIAQKQLQDDARKKLAQLVMDEERNRADTETAAEREAWFREFEEFVISMATFLEQKVPDLQDIERTWYGHLHTRTRLVGDARSNAFVDQLSLFFGVPASWPCPRADEEDGEKLLPANDGDAFSEKRTLRRQSGARTSSFDHLSSADQTAFDTAQEEVKKRLEGLLSDVQAAEYRDIAARIVNEDGTSRIHPSSLVARFHRWRRSYAQEYDKAWGGLTLAQIAEFWIRRSLCGWDIAKPRSNPEQDRSLDSFSWYVDLTHYADKGHDVGTEQTALKEAIGGDDEIVAHAVTNTVIPVLRKICGSDVGAAFDPWSAEWNGGMLDIVEQLTYVIEKDDGQLQSLVANILAIFKRHVDALTSALGASPNIAAPAISPEGPMAVLTFAQNIYVGLTRHLLAWNRFVVSAQRPVYLDLIDEMIVKAVLPLFQMARLVSGGAEMITVNAKDLLSRTTRAGLLAEQTRVKVEEMAGER